MRVDDLQYYEAWLSALQPDDPLALWTAFAALDDLPPLTFSIEASAVYSSNIEGNSIDLDSFMRSKVDRQSRAFRAKEHKEIEALIEAYRFAQTHALNEQNLLEAHRLLSKPILPRSQRGRYRNQLVFVYSQRGIEYAAIEPERVPDKMAELF